MIEQNIKVKVNVENNIVIDKTEEKKLCKILVSKGEDGKDGTVSFDELTEEQKASLKGEDGKGVPEGGKAGQILAKTSDDDFDATWIDNNAEIDLTDYAKKEEIPTKTSELENDSNFLDKNANYNLISGRTHFYNAHESGNGKTRIDIAVGNIQGAESGGGASTLHLNRGSDKDVHFLYNGTGTLYYKNKEVATQEYVNEQIENIEVSSEDIPTKTSELENDSGFITEIGLEEKDYVSKEYVDEKVASIEASGGVDLSNYALKEELPTKTSQLENDSGYVTNTDYASDDNVGLVKTERYYGLHSSSRNGTLYCEQLSYDEYTNDKDGNCFISKGTLENVLEAKDYASKGYVDEQISNIEAIGGSSSVIYSTEEQLIGKWVNNKNLYRKVIQIGEVSTSEVRISAGISNLEEVTDLRGGGTMNAGQFLKWGFENAGGFSSCYYDKNINSVIAIVSTTNYNLKKSHAILEYTKTTD